MFALWFLQPWLALAAAPIGAAVVLVHLLRPGRHRPVRWAAMQFLLAAVAESRRRLRLERWLLVLLRTALLVLLALLIARPVQRGLPGLLAADDSRAVLVIVDNGLAMQAPSTLAPHTLMDEAVEAAAPALLSANPVAVLPAVGDASVQWIPRGGSAESPLRQVPPTAGRADWPSLFAHARQVLPGSGVAASRRTVLLLTSLASGNWPKVEQLAQPLADLRGAAGRIVLVDVRPAARDNLAVTDLAVEPAFAGRDLPPRAVAGLANYGAVGIPVKVAWSVDGREVRLDDIGPIPAGSRTSLAADVPAFAAGEHNVEVRLVGPADALHADDRRWSAVAMPGSLRIVLVEPDPAAPPAARPSLFVAAALAAASAQASVPIRVDTVSAAQVCSGFFEPADAVFLCDVPDLSAADWQQLDEQVDRGCGLLAWCGPRSLLQSGAGRPGTLLSVLAHAADIARTGADGAVRLAEPVRPALLDLAQQGAPSVDAALGSVSRLLRVQPPADAQVLARTAAGDPLVLLHRAGRSCSVLVATSPDLSWTSMPSRPAFPAFVLGLLREVLASPDLHLQVTCGRPIRLPLPASASSRLARWIRPDGSAEPAQISLDAGRLDAVLPLAALPGAYQLETTAGSRTVFANADPQAGNLAALPAPAGRLLSQAGISIVDARDLSQSLSAGGSGDLGGPLAAMLLAILLAELSLTAWFTRARQA